MNRSVCVKDVFSVEELRTSVTSGQYRQLEQNFTAIDVRNAVFQWPYGVDSNAVNALHNQQTHSNPWHRLTKGGYTGKNIFQCFAKNYIFRLLNLTVENILP